MYCSIDKLTIQELTYFCYFVDAIHRNWEILILKSGSDDYDTQRLTVLAQCFNMCARLLGMFGWIDIRDEELRSLRCPNNRHLICHIQECMAKVYDNVMTWSKSLSTTDRGVLRQGYVQLFNAERRFLTMH